MTKLAVVQGESSTGNQEVTAPPPPKAASRSVLEQVTEPQFAPDVWLLLSIK